MAATSTERTQKRRAKLNKFAQEYGYKTWYQFATGALRGELEISRVKLPDKEVPKND